MNEKRRQILELAAPMVPHLITRWERQVGQVIGRFPVYAPAQFAVAEARVLAEMLLQPPEENMLDDAIRQHHRWNDARGGPQATTETEGPTRSSTAAESARTSAATAGETHSTAEGAGRAAIPTGGE